MTAAARLRPAAIVGLLLLAAGCNNGASSPVAPDQSAIGYVQTDLTVGTGTEAVAGSTATVQYLGYLYSETAVDHKGAQIDPGGTFSFVVGGGTIIKGFDMAVTGMKVGGVRRVIMPPSLAYGSIGSGTTIPPNAALVFDILLGGVQ